MGIFTILGIIFVAIIVLGILWFAVRALLGGLALVVIGGVIVVILFFALKGCMAT